MLRLAVLLVASAAAQGRVAHRRLGEDAVHNNLSLVLAQSQADWLDQTSGSKKAAAKGPRSIAIPSTSAKCPPPPTAFFPRRNVQANAGAEVLKTVTGTTLSALAATCRNTPFCVAIDTQGNLWTGIKNASLTEVAVTNPCYAIYIAKAPKRWLGLGAAFEPRLKAARENGAQYVQQQTDFQDQVDTVRAVLTSSETGALSETETFSLVTEALGFTNDLTKRRRLLQATNQSSPDAAVNRLIRAASAPAVWDPRNPGTTNGVNYQCGVPDQGDCGSCQAFSAIGVAEYAIGWARKQKCPVQLSQQWMFFCNGQYNPTCDTGWMPDEAADVLKRVGVRSASCFPYTGYAGCQSGCSNTGSPISGKFSITLFGPNDIDAAKQFLREKGAIYSYMDAYADFQYYSSGVYEHRSGKYEGGHSMMVLGYDDNQRAWIVRNSWGTDWGIQGYVLFSYNDPMLMKGDYYNMVGVTYTESSVTPVPTTVKSPPPARQNNPTVSSPPPAFRPTNNPPPAVVNGGSLLCSVTFYSGERYTGLGMQLQWSKALTANQAGCGYLGDFSKTQPSFAYLPTSMKMKCTCSGTSTTTQCWNMAKNVVLFAFTQSFAYYKAAGILDPDYETDGFDQTSCTASGCNYGVPILYDTWYRTLNAAGLCYNMADFGPAYV